MILYVNGDSHTAGAEAVNPHAFAEDDPTLEHLKRLPHPDNLAVSWGKKLSTTLKLGWHCDAESASSNDRIIRTTKEYLETHSDVFVIIQWSTWEREEWLIDDTYYQINASGIDIVPESHQEKYKQYVANVNWQTKTIEAHAKIIEMHEYLDDRNIPHIFFNGNNNFSKIADRYNWGLTYINPYDNFSFNDYLLNEGIEHVMPGSYHFGTDGHTKWANFMLKYIVKNNLI